MPLGISVVHFLLMKCAGGQEYNFGLTSVEMNRPMRRAWLT